MPQRASEPLLRESLDVGLRTRVNHSQTMGETQSVSDASELGGEDHEARQFGFFEKGRDFESYDTNHIWTKQEKVSGTTTH